MATCKMVLVLLAASLGQNGADNQAALSTASAELARQLELLQRSFAAIPGPPEGRGLFKQAESIQFDVIYFRQQLKRQVSREDLALAFDKVDTKTNTLVADIQPFTNWVPSVRTASRAVQSALHDLQFALSAGDDTALKKPQIAYRQTLTTLNRIDELKNLAVYVFDEMDALPAWTSACADAQRSLVGLQKRQQDKAGPDELKAQMLVVGEAWEKVVGLYKQLPQGQHFLLGQDVSRVDQAIARLNPLFGVANKRRPLTTDW